MCMNMSSVVMQNYPSRVLAIHGVIGLNVAGWHSFACSYSDLKLTS